MAPRTSSRRRSCSNGAFGQGQLAVGATQSAHAPGGHTLHSRSPDAQCPAQRSLSHPRSRGTYAITRHIRDHAAHTPTGSGRLTVLGPQPAVFVSLAPLWLYLACSRVRPKRFAVVHSTSFRVDSRPPRARSDVRSRVSVLCFAVALPWSGWCTGLLPSLRTLWCVMHACVADPSVL